MAISRTVAAVLLVIATIAAAIGVAQPTLPEKLRDTYAHVIETELRHTRTDPLVIVALVHHESHWIASAVSPDGEDVGLGAIRLRYEPGCRRDKNPLDDPSAECMLAQKNLFDGAYNLRRTLNGWKENAKLCRSQTNRTPTEAEVLASYGGMNRPAEGIWCGLQKVKGRWQALPLPKQIKEVLAYRQFLRRQLHSHSSLPSQSPPRPRGTGALTVRSTTKKSSGHASARTSSRRSAAGR